ncbi:MAG: hypothetical protein GXO92_05975 [FCB group bacterium]|nr:hypothetical protein [FCB group bacterium]
MEIIKNLLDEDVFLLDLKEDITNQTLKIFVDSARPVTLDMTSEIAKKIRDSGLLDTFYPQGYRLEVSSPGVGTPLTLPFQFRKNKGRKLSLTLSDGAESVRLKATLLDVTDQGILVSDKKGKDQFIAYDEIINARVVIEFK